jgi:tRNA (guanine-N7-)-methyltransferase
VQTHINSFVRRTARLTKGQAKAIKLLKDYSFNLEEFDTSNINVLDVGFGTGDDLLVQTNLHKNIQFLGVEVYIPGVANLLGKLNENTKNLKLFNDDVFTLLDNLPKNSLDRVSCLYPDPWPKKKQNKRRLIRPLFVKHLLNVLKKGGVFHIKTDSDSYAIYIYEFMKTFKNFEVITSFDVQVAKINHVPTKFSKKGDIKGHKHWSFTYQVKE